MDCIFPTLTPRQCGLKCRCEGIYSLIKQAGGTQELAKLYARYAWLRTMGNKLYDILTEPARTVSRRLFKSIAYCIYPLSQTIIGDPFGIDHQIRTVEERIRQYESQRAHLKADPMVYFNLVGEGYSCLFYYLGVSLRKPTHIRLHYAALGRSIGTLVALRDSVKDLPQDRKNGHFNPFLFWKPVAVRKFNQQQNRLLTKQIRYLTRYLQIQPRSSTKTSVIPLNVSDALRSLRDYALNRHACHHHAQNIPSEIKQHPSPWQIAAQVIPVFLWMIPSVFFPITIVTPVKLLLETTSTVTTTTPECCCCCCCERCPNCSCDDTINQCCNDACSDICSSCNCCTNCNDSCNNCCNNCVGNCCESCTCNCDCGSCNCC